MGSTRLILSRIRAAYLVTALLPSDDFLIDPLPNLLFTRDSSVWIRGHVAITSLAMPACSLGAAASTWQEASMKRWDETG